MSEGFGHVMLMKMYTNLRKQTNENLTRGALHVWFWLDFVKFLLICLRLGLPGTRPDELPKSSRDLFPSSGSLRVPEGLKGEACQSGYICSWRVRGSGIKFIFICFHSTELSLSLCEILTICVLSLS